MSGPALGVLGAGYLGAELLRLPGRNYDLWATVQQAKPSDQPRGTDFTLHPFQWDEQRTWENLPDVESVLVITIPPLNKDVRSEKSRLQKWCKWIHSHRVKYKRCIYISSTGVYPNLPGLWSETSISEPDSNKGRLRKISEQILSEQFETVVIRAGAIYGPGRNIGEKILNRRPIPKGSQKIHRIHVRDLAAIVRLMAFMEDPPDCINAIDLESETTANVAQWLVSQPFFPANRLSPYTFQKNGETRKYALSEPHRKIDNRRLVEEYHFQFDFPTYREGLRHAFKSE